MRIPHTEEPLWFGREFTACELVHHVAAHHIERYNRIAPHILPCWELGVVETRGMDLLLDDKPLHVSAGEMVVIAPGSQIRSGEGRNAGRFYWIGLDPSPDTHEATHPWLTGRVGKLADGLEHRSGQTVFAGDSLMQRARELVGLCLDTSSDPLRRCGVSLTLAAEAAAALRPGSEPTSTPESAKLSPALELVRCSRADRPSVAELAEACGMPRATFCEQFRRCIGQTPAQYVRQQQIEQAASMLRTTNHSVTRIAHESGFSSSQYLSAVFRRFVGQSPTEYRRAYNSSAGTESNDTSESSRYAGDSRDSRENNP